MNPAELEQLINKVSSAQVPEAKDLEALLSVTEAEQLEMLFSAADRMRRCLVGPGILIRGIIEFSSHCKNRCNYCGLTRDNTELTRYRMSYDRILRYSERIARLGIKTIVLQCGEDPQLSAEELADTITRIKSRFDVAITLSCGERPRADYAIWKQAGADRYLLKIETTDRDLYQKLHPQMSFENRLKCLEELKNLAYQVGSGNIVGLPDQSVRSLAEDIIFFKRAGLDMIGLGPFIPHPKTSLGKARPGSVDMTLKVLALTRLVTKRTHMPASTALAVLGGDHGTDTALRAGANVVMPNFTGGTFKKQYEIYPAKAERAPDPGEYLARLADQARQMDRFVDYSRGDCVEDKSLEKVT